MKIIFLISTLFLAFSFGYGQHVIKVKKGQTIKGVFVYEEPDKSKDYFLFNEEGLVYILENTKRKPNKAVPFMLACIENKQCNELKSVDYTFEKNTVEFSFTSANYIRAMEGMFQENGTKLIFKQSETDQLMVIKEFKRVE